MEDRTERTGGLFRAIVLIVTLVTLGAAIARLIVSGQVTGSGLSEADAVALAPCLPSDTLKPNLHVKLAQPVATAMDQALVAEYFASADAPSFTLDKVDASSNTLKRGEPLEMTGGTVRVRSQALVKFNSRTFILSVAKEAPLDFKVADEDTVVVRAGGKIAVDPSTHKLVDAKAPIGTVAIAWGKDIDVTDDRRSHRQRV